MKRKWLCSWIGTADLRGQHGDEASGRGPIAAAVQHATYDEIILLSSQSKKDADGFAKWLLGRCKARISVYQEELPGPTHYAAIYERVTARLAMLGLPSNSIDITFHLSPGTPAMASIWIILAKTRFPANLIEASREDGVRMVDFPFDLAADFVSQASVQADEALARLGSYSAAPAAEFRDIVHQSTSIRNLIDLAQRISVRNVPVLIQGESGTGKELFARAIHTASTRAAHPFIAVNCGAIAAGVVDSELFGHAKGAFTGASQSRKGYVEEANGGTLFLDEIGELPLDAQVKLLRVMQQQEVTPVGATRPVKLDVRFICATNRTLLDEVVARRFREDLFYRVAVAILDLPPLRARTVDIVPLAEHFLGMINDEAAAAGGTMPQKLTSDAKRALGAHTWPGNVRELYHTLLRASIWSSSQAINARAIESAILRRGLGTANPAQQVGDGLDLRTAIGQVARQHLAAALQQADGNKTKAAKLLGFKSYQTFDNWAKRYDTR